MYTYTRNACTRQQNRRDIAGERTRRRRCSSLLFSPFFVLALALALWSTSYSVAEAARPPHQVRRRTGTSRQTATTPALVRLALAGKDELGQSNGMTVSWTTQVETKASLVLYGTDAKNLSSRQEGYQQKYLYTSHHHVTLQNLKPSTTYFYTCGDDDTNTNTDTDTDLEGSSRSQVFSFQTAPSLATGGGANQSFTIAIYGDMGAGDCSAETRQQLQNTYDGIDWVWHLGDIAYADDYLFGEFAYERVLDQYMEEMAFLAARKPYMVLPGNHEVDCHAFVCLLDKTYRDALKNFTAYNARWKMPSKESDGILNMWYSFNYGQAHFVSLDSETDYKGAYEGEIDRFFILKSGHFSPEANGYLKWLERDLQQAFNERHMRPWIIVAGHRPMYLHDDVGVFRAAVEELLLKYEVDLYLSGHVHEYYRTFPVRNGSDYVPHYDNRQGRLTNVIAGGPGADWLGTTGTTGTTSSPLASAGFEWILNGLSQTISRASAATRRKVRDGRLTLTRVLGHLNPFKGVSTRTHTRSGLDHHEEDSVVKEQAKRESENKCMEDNGDKYEYLAFCSYEKSFGLLHFVDENTIKWELISSKTGEVLDTLQLTK